MQLNIAGCFKITVSIHLNINEYINGNLRVNCINPHRQGSCLHEPLVKVVFWKMSYFTQCCKSHFEIGKIYF